ncbi:MAG: C_GCAxxG_C_C family protein, partial [Ruminococcus sp.]|nr:C_GCAxxG_C_C family protein [Ruminococcus sp.]
DDLDSRNKTNQMTNRLLDRFKELNETNICNEKLGCDITTQEGVEYAIKHELFTTTCRDMVALAVQVLEEIIE